MKLHKAISLLFFGLFSLCLFPGSSNGQDRGNYIGEFCFDMVNTQTLIYDVSPAFTGLLRLSVFSAPSGIYTVNGSLTLTPNSATVIPLVGTAVSIDDSRLGVSLTGSTGFFGVPSVEFYTTIAEGVQVPLQFLGLAHRYISLGPLGAPPPADLKEIGHQPIAGTLTPRVCP
jgi:hypothetical protein